MSKNYLSIDGFQKWLGNDQDTNNNNIIGVKVYSKISFSNLLEVIESVDSNNDDYEMAKYFRKHGGRIAEISTEGLIIIETKKGKFIIEKENLKKHQN